MRKISLTLMLGMFVASASFTSCKKKEECHECHYDDANGAEVELGEKCGEELEDLEANGYTTGGTTHEVHCHGH